MKFLRRKSGRDEDLEHYVDLGVEVPPSKVQPSPAATPSTASFTGIPAAGAGPSLPAKDLPPPPLYAKFARMTTTTSVESLGATATGALDARAGSRFSAYNGSTASGFGASLHSATPSADSHANGPASYGRATGSSLFSGGNTAGAKASLASASSKEAAKPEPIKLKNRRRRFDEDAPKATSAADNAKSTIPRSSSRPSTATNGSSDPTPNGTPKPSMDGNTGGATGIISRASVLSNGTSSTRSAAERHVPNGATSSMTSLTHSTSLGTSSISTTPSRSAAVPTPTQPPQLDDDPNDVFSFYNAAVRMSENPPSNARSPSPVRPKEGPPISLLNRAQKSHLTTDTQALSSTQDQESDILVKPPSRRESLQHAAKSAMDPVKPPVSPTVATQRAPSPVKPRTVAVPEPRVAELSSEAKRQASLPTPSSTSTDSVGEPGMAGVGAGARFSLQMGQSKTRPGSIQERPAPGIVFSGHNQRSASPISQNRITASPVSITAPSDTIVPLRAATPEHKYPTSIADKTPLVRHTSPSKVPTPSAIPTSTSSTPRASSQPIPSSATSSISTTRQSRLQNLNGRAESPTRREEPIPAPQSVRPTATTRSNIPLPESKAISYNRGVALTDNSFTPSRQNSSTSVASSSVPSATRSASATTTPSGLETPDDMSPSPITRSPESTKEISRITLKKGSNRINGVNHSRDADTTPPATTSPPQRRVYSQDTDQESVTTSRVREEVARRESARKNLEHGYKEERRQRVEAPVHVKQEVPPPQEPVAEAYSSTMSEAARYASDHGHGSADMHSQQSIDAGMHERSASVSNNDRGYYAPQPSRSRHIPNPEYEFDPDIIYPIEQHLAVPELLASSLLFLQFSDVLALTTVSKTIRNMLEDRKELREEILERFLGTVGYMRWDFGKKREPLVLTLRDLNSYLRGVSIPIHRYAEIAETQNFNAKEGKSRIVRLLASSTRAYSKVVLRLRSQAEMEATLAQQEESQADRSRPHSPLVRAQSPPNSSGTWKRMFHSPLYRIGHAPLLRVFVPSADGPWLSDTSVLACEKELKRAGITQLLKIGDVVWDTAVSDEAGFGNVGRLIWDGNYLIDLDYTFSTTGDVPPYLHSLSFPPAYFHKVLRSSGNPIMQIDLRPWGREIASNLQLVQDRVQAETPQGGRHTVMRWTHRTRFQVTRGTPIPDTNLSVDAGWEGVLVLEAEGTNEGLADLQLRCGMEWFKPQPGVQPKQGDGGRVFRLIRERSRPGEIWLRTVRMKERIS